MYDRGSILRQASFSQNRCCTPKWRPVLMDILLSKTLLTLERIAMQHRGNGVAGRMRYCIIRARECTLPASIVSVPDPTPTPRGGWVWERDYLPV